MASRTVVGMAVGLCLALALEATAQQRPPDAVLAVVNGEPVRQSQVQRLFQSRRVPEKLQPQALPLFLNELVDAAVMRKYLADRDALPSPQEVAAAVEKLKLVAAKATKDPDKFLEQAGFSDEALSEEVTLPLAWQKHVQRVVTRDSLKTYYEAHREEFDGTKIHAYHVFIKVDTTKSSPALTDAETLLANLRKQILAGQMTFEQAAQTYSQGPSASKGGDIGEFTWHGKMPDAFCRVAFKLKKGEISEPFRSPFGVHVCTVVGKKPGGAPLEDVREAVLAQMSQEMWTKTAAEQRAKAKIEWRVAKP